jgi:hypothetical protein
MGQQSRSDDGVCASAHVTGCRFPAPPMWEQSEWVQGSHCGGLHERDRGRCADRRRQRSRDCDGTRWIRSRVRLIGHSSSRHALSLAPADQARLLAWRFPLRTSRLWCTRRARESDLLPEFAQPHQRHPFVAGILAEQAGSANPWPVSGQRAHPWATIHVRTWRIGRLPSQALGPPRTRNNRRATVQPFHGPCRANTGRPSDASGRWVDLPAASGAAHRVPISASGGHTVTCRPFQHPGGCLLPFGYHAGMPDAISRRRSLLTCALVGTQLQSEVLEGDYVPGQILDRHRPGDGRHGQAGL